MNSWLKECTILLYWPRDAPTILINGTLNNAMPCHFVNVQSKSPL